MYYVEMTRQELADSHKVRQEQIRRRQAHAAWHEEYSSEYGDCPFQLLGSDWLTREERAAIEDITAGLDEDGTEDLLGCIEGSPCPYAMSDSPLPTCVYALACVWQAGNSCVKV